MRFENVRLPAFAHVLPEEVVSSEELERRLAPIYGRLGLSPGRIELMSGIRERRFWPPGTRPSEPAARAGAQALERSGLAREELGLLIHASVCRDFMEPATASVVHRLLELPRECVAYDLSNACLGFANAMCVAAQQLEAGAIGAALIVACEDGRPLVEETVRALNEDPAAGRAALKRAHASLTIGAGAAAVVMTRAERAPEAARLVAATSRAATEHVELCSGDRRAGAGGPLMETDSEALMHAGIALAAETWELFLREAGWSREQVDRVVTHQVGSAHRRLLLEAIGVAPERDHPTVETLGNVGSVSLPLTYDRACAAGHVARGQRVGLLGIGSGLQCAMLALAG